MLGFETINKQWGNYCLKKKVSGVTGMSVKIWNLCGATQVDMDVGLLEGLWLANQNRYLNRHGRWFIAGVMAVKPEPLPEQTWTLVYWRGYGCQTRTAT